MITIKTSHLIWSSHSRCTQITVYAVRWEFQNLLINGPQIDLGSIKPISAKWLSKVNKQSFNSFLGGYAWCTRAHWVKNVLNSQITTLLILWMKQTIVFMSLQIFNGKNSSKLKNYYPSFLVFFACAEEIKIKISSKVVSPNTAHVIPLIDFPGGRWLFHARVCVVTHSLDFFFCFFFYTSSRTPKTSSRVSGKNSSFFFLPLIYRSIDCIDNGMKAGCGV